MTMRLWDQFKHLFVDASDVSDRAMVKEQIDQVRGSRERADTAIDELQAQAERAIQAHLPSPSGRYDVATALRQARQTGRGRAITQGDAPGCS